MARKMRFFAPGAIFHVYCRVARGNFVFEAGETAEAWIDAVACACDLHRQTILGWCLMSNHFHLVIRMGDVPLWRTMAKIQVRVAKDQNRRMGWKGPLWQSRYKARLVGDAGDLENLFAYVHLNPVAAGIVEDPGDYPLSGHRSMIGLAGPDLVDVAAALECFDEDQVVGRRKYLQRIRSVAESKWLMTRVEKLPWWQTVDEDDETVTLAQAPSDAVDFDGEAAPEKALRPDLDEVVRLCEILLGLGRHELRSRSRRSDTSWYRCLVTLVTVGWLGFESQELATHLDKSPTSVSRWLKEGFRLSKTEPGFRRQLEMLERRINELPTDWKWLVR